MIASKLFRCTYRHPGQTSPCSVMTTFVCNGCGRSICIHHQNFHTCIPPLQANPDGRLGATEEV